MTSANEKYLSLIRTISDLIGAITGASKIVTANNLLAIREEMHDGQKIRDDANGAKLKELVKDIEAPNCHLILCSNNIGSWLTVQGTTVTSTVLADTEFHEFLCARYDSPPPQPLNNKTANISPYLYVLVLAAVKEVLSLHVKMKCVTNSSTLIEEPSSINMYAENSSSARVVAYQMRRYFRGGV